MVALSYWTLKRWNAFCLMSNQTRLTEATFHAIILTALIFGDRHTC